MSERGAGGRGAMDADEPGSANGDAVNEAHGHEPQHLLPDPSAGDESTLGGYARVHARPAAFEGTDGFSYSVEPCAAETGERASPWGGYLLFLRWRRIGASGVEGHLESDFVVRGASEREVLDALDRMPLLLAKATLDTLVRKQPGGPPARRWWDVMRAEGEAVEDEAPNGALPNGAADTAPNGDAR